jgi:hypothetical protein
MNPYTVDWTPAAEDALTLIWLQTFDPAVTVAQTQIERLLARNPLGHGQPVHEGLYCIIELPLKVFYSIDQARNFVEVSEVWYVP